MKNRAPISTEDLDVTASDQGAQLQGADTLDVNVIKKRSVAGVLSYAMRTVLLQLINAAAITLFSIFLSVEEYGVYGFVIVISGFFTIISDIGLGASVIQKSEEPTRDELRTVFTVQQILGWVVCALIVMTSYAMLQFGKLTVPGFYLAIALGITFPIVSLKTVSSLILERKLEFNKLVIPVMVETVVFNIVAILLTWRGFGVLSFAVAMLVRSLIGVGVMWMIQSWDIGFAFSKKAFDSLMKVGLKFQINDMLAKTKDELFTIIIRFMLTDKGFGYVQWSQKIANMPRNFSVDSVLAVTFSTYARMQHDTELMRKAIEKTIFFVTLIAFPLLGGFSIMLYPTLQVIPRLLKWEPALISVGLFSISIAFSTISTPLVSVLNSMGKIHISLRLMIMWTILQWVITPICIYYYGFTGVALAQALIGLTVFIVIYITKKYVQFAVIDQVWRQLLSAIAMIIVLFWYRGAWGLGPLYLAGGVMVGALIYGAVMLVFGYKKVTLEVRSLINARKA